MYLILNAWVASKETVARANVVLKSLVAGLNNGRNISWPPSLERKKPIVPTPGRRPRMFEKKMKMKKLANQGKMLLLLFPAICSVRV